MRRLVLSLLFIGVLAALPAAALQAEDVRSMDKRGITLYQQGDYEGALQAFRDALEVAPHDGLTLVLEGAAYLATSDERAADDAWAEAANDEVWGSVADALSGLLRWHRGDTLDAKTWFGMCKRHTPAYPYCVKLTNGLANGDPVPEVNAWMQLSGFEAVAAQQTHHHATSAAPAIGSPHRSSTSARAFVSNNPPGAGAPPPGAYRCMTSSVGMLYQMGQIVINGSTYRYAPTGGALSAPAAFTMDSAKHLHWHGAMGALTQAPAQIVDSWLERGSNFLSIIVKYKPQPNGYTFTMGCRNDLH